MKNYWNHRDAETEMLLAAAFFQLVRPGYGEKFRDAVKEIMAKVCANPSAFTPKRRGVCKACFKSPFPYAVYYYEREEDIVVLAYAHEKRRPGYWRYRLQDV